MHCVQLSRFYLLLPKIEKRKKKKEKRNLNPNLKFNQMSRKPPFKLKLKYKPNPLSLTVFTFIALFFFFLLLIFTPLGDSFAASGRRSLHRTPSISRQQLISIIDGGDELALEVPACVSDDVDQMPCEDPKRNAKLSREMNFYRERHCPSNEDKEICLVMAPKDYRVPIPWPDSLFKIWHGNMPYDKIADRKGHQGWMKKEGPHFIFPGGGTMFPDGAVHYIEKLGRHIPINDGILRTALDMGCGVASFGGFLLEKNIMTLSFAPRDSHKSQIQFALERGIPAFVAMLGTRRLPFPAFAFDLVHCSRCLIPFAAYNASYILEVDRLLRPGGYLVISGPPVQWAKREKEWAQLQAAAKALCYEVIIIEGNTVIWKKPLEPTCLPNENEFGIDICKNSDDLSEAWYFKLKPCVNKISSMQEVALDTRPKWPERLSKPPQRVSHMEDGATMFEVDTKRWAKRIEYYKKSLGLKLGTPKVRNIMDMNAYFGSFAAALISDPVWVMNTVPAYMPRTLDVIYDRGLIGVYHDWCEAFSTYPRTYDFIHVDRIDSLTKDADSGNSRCHLIDVIVEMDRILRPEGTAIIRDSQEIIDKVKRIANAVRWEVHIHDNEDDSNSDEKILVATKKLWKL